jgi:serine protease SohB
MKHLIPFTKKPPLVSVVRLSGVIASGGRNNLNDAGLAASLEKAFTKGKPQAVALVINSPGGSPVQSSLIGARIRRLAEENDIPVLAFVEDVAASGGYWLAAAADEIFVDPSSITGSIGVISASFGFSELMARYGIERRVYTAGKDKSMADPFRPEREEDVVRIKALQAQIHKNFKDHVTARRGDKLPTDQDLFTGEIWVGEQAIEVGLVDAVGHVVPTLKARYGDKVRLRVVNQKRSVFQRFNLRPSWDMLNTIDEKALWGRFGL